MPRDGDTIDSLIDALAVTAELTGTEFSKAAVKVMATDLAAYPLTQVLGALTRCRRELKSRLTIAAIIERLDDGRPGPNEAWAMIPQDESGSVVWTEEMAEAFGVAAPLLHEGQIIAARSAFIEAYQARVAIARNERRFPKWSPSLGHDPAGRETALLAAIEKGRLTHERVRGVLPAPVCNVELLEHQRVPMPENVRIQLATFLGNKVAKSCP
jgi:hypothetical protein